MLEAGGPRVPSRPVLAMVKLFPKPQAVLLGSGCRTVQDFMFFLAGHTVLIDTCKSV